jgi:hypothetical protein
VIVSAYGTEPLPRLDVKPTCDLIALALTSFGGIYPYTRYLCVDRVAHSFCTHEKDLICVSPNGYAYEVEIKISIADLKRDKLKARWRHNNGGSWLPIRAMSFAMPPEVWAHPDAEASVPEQCGVITVDVAEPIRSRQVKIVREARKVTRQKVSDSDRAKLYHLAHDRYWSRRRA